MFSIFRIIAEFLSYFFAINAFMAKKNVSLAERVRNLISNFGAELDEAFNPDFASSIFDELLDEVISLWEKSFR
jgi:hypothetical protein